MDHEADRLGRREFRALAERAAQHDVEALGLALSRPSLAAALLEKTRGGPVVAFVDGTLAPDDPRAYPVAAQLGIVDQAVAAGRLILTAEQAEHHRQIKVHGARRVLQRNGDWERDRESDIAHTLRNHGADSPSLAAAKRALQIARATRRREAAHAARVLAGCLASPLRVRAVEQQRRPRPRGAGRPRGGARRRPTSTRAGPDDEPEPALRLAPPPKTIYRFACLTPEQRGEA